MTSSASRIRPAYPVLPFSLLAAFLGACSSSDDDENFVVETTTQAAEPSAPIVIGGDWMVYFASEAFTGPTGTNLNADPDKTDQVAFAVDLRSNVETNLGVAARAAVIVDDDIYLKVDETLDGVDWSGTGGIGQTVLLHWSSDPGTLAFIDVLDPQPAGELPRVVESTLYYASATAPAGVDETNLRKLTSFDPLNPTAPVTVGNEVGAGNVSAHLIGEEEGLLFCVLDETDDAVDRNGDGDATDQHVLALLDGTDAAGRLKSVELALSSDAEPLAARVLAANDWLVAFLVDEAGQSPTSLNNKNNFTQPLLPGHCAAVTDTDTTDRVLFFLEFADFLMGASQPVNTGIAGHDRVLALDGFVATISDELDANCNLNERFMGLPVDSDMTDDVARWVATTTPVAPAVDPDDLRALATGVGGGSMGLAVLSDRLVAVIDEAADGVNHDGKVPNHELVAWLDPEVGSPSWHFSHQSSTRSIGTGVFDDDGDPEPFAGTSWMAREAVDGRLPLVFLEEVPGTNPDVGSLNTNLNCDLVVKDTDKMDGLPVWADFESGPTLDFDGMGYAVDLTNAGIEIAVGFAFFRVSEAADSRDYNGDGQMNDVVLFRNPLTTCGPVFMGTSTLIPGQVITTDHERGAGFLSSEMDAGEDLNGDGDTGDQVVQFFRF